MVGIRRFAFLLIALVVPVVTALAQTSVGRGGTSYGYTLTVTSNVPGAIVLVNGEQKGTTPYSASYGSGTFSVTVQAPGYSNFTTNVTLPGAPPVNAYLQPLNYQLSIGANVNGAQVTINGTPSGQTPLSISLQPGTYNITVQVAGYTPYSTTVTLPGTNTINAVLQLVNYNVTIGSNIPRAEVIINGTPSGRTPLTISLQPGTYNLTVRAPRYQDYNTQFTVNQDMSVNAQLTPQMATLRFVLPNDFRNRDFDEARARNNIAVFLDNRHINWDNIQVEPGNHVIRFQAGGLMVQSTISVVAGQVYLISPQLTIAVAVPNQ